MAEVTRCRTSTRLVVATADAEDRQLELILSATRGPRSVIAVCRDVSEQVRAEQALRTAAEAEQRRRDYSEFLSRVSHELRTPLNAVLGFAQLLLQEAAPVLPTHQVHWLDQIRRGGQYLLSLIEDVLSLTRADAGHHRLEPMATSICSALRDATDLLAPLAGTAEVAFSLPDDDAASMVLIDRRALRQVLVNVLGNAVKYNRRGGTVWVELERIGLECRVSIRDEGRGIEPTDLSRLFVPFERLGAEHGSIPGTGLGLAIARRLIESSGGWIDAESPPGSGLRVRIGLPLSGCAIGDTAAMDMATLDLPAVVESLEVGRGARHAVFVEDNEVNLQLMEAIFLRHPEWVLQLHDDAPWALNAVLAEPPVLLLLDLNMPGLSGMAFIRAVRAEPRCRHLVCVAVTADASEQTRRDALAAGFDDFWTKPIDPRKVDGFLTRFGSLNV